MHRRDFLRLAACASAYGLASPARSAAPLRPSSGWSERRVVVRSEELPMGGLIQNFTSSAEPLEGDAWRLWISVSGDVPFNIGYAEGVPGEKMRLQFAELSPGEPADAPLAIGNLPVGWQPKQAVHLQLKNGRHRLYFWAHGKGIVRYLAAESEDGRRYRVIDPLKACVYHPADRTVDGPNAAEAGLKRRSNRKAKPEPGESLAPGPLIVNDATTVFQLPDGSFEMFTAALVEVAKDDPRYMAHDNVPGLVRVIVRLQSEDGLHWTDRRQVITRDDQDPIDLQHYYLGVTHTERGRIGLLGHYRVQAQTMDLEWCHSADGIRWERSARQAWLPRGEPHVSPDSYGIYAARHLVQHQGKWHLFHTGFNEAHNHKDSHGPRTRAILHTAIDSLWA